MPWPPPPARNSSHKPSNLFGIKFWHPFWAYLFSRFFQILAPLWLSFGSFWVFCMHFGFHFGSRLVSILLIFACVFPTMFFPPLPPWWVLVFKTQPAEPTPTDSHHQPSPTDYTPHRLHHQPITSLTDCTTNRQHHQPTTQPTDYTTNRLLKQADYNTSREIRTFSLP